MQVPAVLCPLLLFLTCEVCIVNPSPLNIKMISMAKVFRGTSKKLYLIEVEDGIESTNAVGSDNGADNDSDKEADNGSDEVADSFQMPVMSFIIYMTVMLFQVDASKPIVANGEKLLFQINEYKPTIMRQFCSKRKTLHATFPD